MAELALPKDSPTGGRTETANNVFEYCGDEIAGSMATVNRRERNPELEHLIREVLKGSARIRHGRAREALSASRKPTGI
jgi:hypothetical protein